MLLKNDSAEKFKLLNSIRIQTSSLSSAYTLKYMLTICWAPVAPSFNTNWLLECVSSTVSQQRGHKHK